MSTWNALGAGGRAAVMVMGAAVVGGIGYLVWDGNAPPAPAPVAANLAEPAATEAAVPAAAPAAEPAPGETAAATPPAPVAPSFDNWRVEADGSAVVAGRAEPGAVISVLVDGAMVAEAEAANGEFAALFTLPPNDMPSLMTLEAKLPDGTVLASEQTIAIEPIKGPVEVAAADPEPAPEPAPAAVMVTEEGASVVQPATPVEPEVLANVSVDAITYTPSGAVQLGGAGTAGQFVRVYLDNAAKVTALIPDSGRWLSTLPAVDPGIYTLRVDQIDDAGKVTSRFETPFKRETPEALAAASAPAPEPAVEPAAAEPVATEVAEAAAPATDPAAAPVEPAAEAVAEPAVEAVAEAVVAEPAPEPAPLAEAAAEPAPAAEPAVAAATPEAAPAEPAAAEPAATEAAATEAAPETAATTETTATASVEAAAPAPAAPVTVTVQPGFTLWKIAQENFGEGVMYVQVFEANKDKIRDPDLIYPGQVFTIPASE